MQGISQHWHKGLDVIQELYKPMNVENPYPLLSWVREHEPVHLSSSGVYFVSRYDDTLRVLQDQSTFRSPDGEELSRRWPNSHMHRSQQLLMKSIIMQRPPDHTRLRRLVSRDFTVEKANSWMPRTRVLCEQIIDSLVEPFHDLEIIDLHSALSLRVPVDVFAELLGVPVEQRAAMVDLMPKVLNAMSPNASAEDLVAGDEADEQMQDCFGELIGERRARPQDDLISLLVREHEGDPDRLTEGELISMVWGMWAGGFATTVTTVDYAALTMIKHPDKLGWLRAGPGETRSFIGELLRYESPNMTSAGMRLTISAIEMHGVKIPARADMRLLVNAANRDPMAFPEPDRFDPSRANIQRLHMAFGGGIHYCLGAMLAQMELGVLLPMIADRLPGLSLAGTPTYRAALPVRAIDRLPVVMSRHASEGSRTGNE